MEVKRKRKMVMDVKGEKKAKIGANVTWDQYKDSLLQVTSVIRSITHKPQRSNFHLPLRPHRTAREEIHATVDSDGAGRDLLRHILCLLRSMAFESQWSTSNDDVVGLLLGSQDKTPVALLSQVNRLSHFTELSQEIILYEILPWLPLDSLFRCKLVCSEWNKVISVDSVFNATHSQRCVRHPPGLLYRTMSGNNIFLDSSMKCVAVNNYDMDLISSSNGLICASTRTYNIPLFKVMNPVTGEGVYVRSPRRFHNVALAFEPSGSHPCFALVGCYVSNAVHDVNIGPILTMGFSLYSSETGSWSNANARVAIVRRTLETHWPQLLCQSVYVGGKVYWKYTPDVFWLDIKEDSAGSVTIPNQEEDFPNGAIGGMNGELTYCTISAEDIIVWVLRENEKKWFQKYVVLLTDIFKDVSGNIPSCCNNAVIRLLGMRSKVRYRRRNHAITGDRCAFPYEGADLLFWSFHSPQSREGMIFSYNMETNTLRILHNSQMKRQGHYALSYQRSRASVPKLLSNNTSLRNDI